MAISPLFDKSFASIFPMANDTSGGQLVTEYNLLGGQRVTSSSTQSTISYGPSLTRTLADFDLSAEGSVLRIGAGMALVNGYFLNSEITCEFDVNAWNEHPDHTADKLKGQLAVGLKTVFSQDIRTEGSLAFDDGITKYSGIQLVIIPRSNSIKFPDTAASPSEVDMDLLLGYFYYSRKTISDIVQNEGKVAYIDPRRIKSASSEEGEDSSSAYPTMDGVVPNQIYALCPQTEGGTTLYWENITNLLFNLQNTEVVRNGDTLYLRIYRHIPHSTDLGQHIDIELPNCDYSQAQSGMASPELIAKVKSLSQELDTYKSLFSAANLGMMVGYIPVAASIEEITAAQQQAISNPDYSDVGSFILVGSDLTLSTFSNSRAPSTIYVVYADSSDSNDTYKWSTEPVIISSEVPIATSSVVGGVVNIDLESEADRYTDRGYVYVDSEGHLRLHDYALLRSGLLAYALTSDFEESASVDPEAIQVDLNNYVNNRIVMPSTESGNEGNLAINVTIPAPSTSGAVYTINNIDSRFGASVHLNLQDMSGVDATINIVNCEKIVVLLPTNSSLNITIVNSNVFYSTDLLNSEGVIFLGCRFWYDSAYAAETGMDTQTISVVDNTVYFSPGSSVTWDTLVDQYNDDISTDIHTQYIPHHIKLDESGHITEVGIRIKCDPTVQLPGTSSDVKQALMISNFVLPSVEGFFIPENRLASKYRFSSEYGIAYKAASPDTTYRSYRSKFDACYLSESGQGVMTEEITVRVWGADASITIVVPYTDHQDEDREAIKERLQELYPSEVIVTGVPEM